MHRKFAAILFLLCSATLLNAQHVATDYNSCLHGVQDRFGKWIIEPLYEQLDGVDHGYIASRSGKYGLLDSSGRVMIPFGYDHIGSIFYAYYFADRKQPPYYKVLVNGKYGIVDTANRVIVPAKFDIINGTADTTFVVKEGPETWVFYNQKGERFLCPWKTKNAPYRLIAHCYSVERNSILGRSKEGIVNDSGRIILQREYMRMSGYERTKTILVRTKKNYGYCNGAGQMLWPLVLTYPHGDRWYNFYSDLAGRLGKGPAYQNGKYGMISVYGDTLLPFIYDDIDPFEDYPSPRLKGNLWVIEKDGLKGIYDDVTGWKVPVSCTTIDNLETYFADGDSAQVGLMVYSRDNLWGAITTNGQEVLPCEYEEFTKSYSGQCIFRKGDKLMMLGILTWSHVSHIESEKSSSLRNEIINPGYRAENERVPASKLFSVYKGREGSTIYYHPGLTHMPIREYSKYPVYLDEGEFYDMVAPDSIIRSGCFYIEEIGQPAVENGSVRLYHINFLQQTSENTSRPDLAYVSSNKKEKISFTDEYHRTAMRGYYITSVQDVISASGRLIMSGDSNDYVMAEFHGANGEIYFLGSRYGEGFVAFDTNGVNQHPMQQTSIGDFSHKYLWVETKNSSHWILIDSKTGKSVLPKKVDSQSDAPIWDSITMIDNDKQGIRLYNITRRQYVCNKGFSYMMPLSTKGDLFIVKTCSGKMGVLRPDGTWLTDTTWTGITPMGSCDTIHDPWNSYIDYYTLYYQYYVFSNESARYLLDIKTQEFTSTENCWNFLWLRCRRSTNSTFADFEPFRWSGIETSSVDDSERQPYFLIPDSDTAVFRTWHKKIIVDTIFGSLRYTINPYLPEVEVEDEEYEYEYYDVDEINRTNRYCWNCGQKYQNFMWTRDACTGKFAPYFVSDSVFSFSDVSNYYWSSWEARYNYTNVFLYPDGPHSMTLDSMFDPDKDWKAFIINTTLNYINSHPNIEGDCHNPVALPILLNNSWQISQRGMMFYPPEFREDYHQLSIWVPMADLEPYLKSDVKMKLTGK